LQPSKEEILKEANYEPQNLEYHAKKAKILLKVSV